MSHSLAPTPDDSAEPRRFYPNLPPGLTGEDVPILSRNAVHDIIGQVVQHALVDNCGHSIAQADCFACGMNHALRGLVVALRYPDGS